MLPLWGRSLVLLAFAVALGASACTGTTTLDDASGAPSSSTDQSTATTDDASTLPDTTDTTVDTEQPDTTVDTTPDTTVDTEQPDTTTDAVDTEQPDTTTDADEQGDDTSDADATDATTDEGDGNGVNEQLAGLITDCEAGSDMACDILFQASDLASPEEQIARTCGGRRPDNVSFCADAMLPDGGELWFDESSPGLPAIVAACEVGDMTACDFLYFRSAVGSTYEEIGNTCAGRTEIALPDCRTAFPEE